MLILSYLLALALALVAGCAAIRPTSPILSARPADLSRVEAITSAVLASLAAPPSARRHRVVVVLPAGRLAGGAL